MPFVFLLFGAMVGGLAVWGIGRAASSSNTGLFGLLDVEDGSAEDNEYLLASAVDEPTGNEPTGVDASGPPLVVALSEYILADSGVYPEHQQQLGTEVSSALLAWEGPSAHGEAVGVVLSASSAGYDVWVPVDSLSLASKRQDVRIHMGLPSTYSPVAMKKSGFLLFRAANQLPRKVV